MSDEGAAEPRVRGTLSRANGVGVVRIEMTVAASTSETWAAVTDPGRLALWAGQVVGELRLGGEYRAHLFPSGWEGSGRVLECDPGHRWLVEGAEADRPSQTDELSLVPSSTLGTVVTLTERGTGLDPIQFWGVGVQIHLENLAAYLGGHAPIDPDLYWDRLLPEYERLAAEL
jgi:uncharacterized protein YndB with AHSA1/START domain